MFLIEFFFQKTSTTDMQKINKLRQWSHQKTTHTNLNK